MQSALKRRRAAWDAVISAHPEFQIGEYTCYTGQSSLDAPGCSPARPDLGAPEIQHCGYRNTPRSRAWINIIAAHGYGVGQLEAEGAAATSSGPVWHSGNPIDGYMARQNLTEIADYAQRTLAILEAHGCQLPEWAEYKLARTRVDLGDVAGFMAYHTGQAHRGAPMQHAGYSAGTVYQARKRRRTARELATAADQSIPSGYRVGATMGPPPSETPMQWFGPDLGSVSVRPIKQGISGQWKGLLIDHAPGGASKPAQGIVVEILGTYNQGTEALIQHPMYGRAIVPFQATVQRYQMPAVSSASRKSAAAVRRYNLYAASREAAGMSVGAPMSGDEAAAMRGVLAAHGYGVGGGCGYGVGGGCGYAAGAPMSGDEAAAMRGVLAAHGYGVGGSNGGCGCGG